MITREDVFKVNVVEHFRTRELITRPDAQRKYEKSGKGKGAVYQAGLSLAPARESHNWNLCAGSSPGCRTACLITAGSNVYGTSRRARILRTRLLMEHPEKFKEYLERDLRKARHYADMVARMPFAFRFNTLSDVDVERLVGHLILRGDYWLDYTKVAGKYRAWLSLPHPWYHLTFSRSETNEAQCLEFLKLGGTCTLVVRDEATKKHFLKAGYMGYPCADGDKSDRRWQDPPAHWILLVAKGKAKRDKTGFVVDKAVA